MKKFRKENAGIHLLASSLIFALSLYLSFGISVNVFAKEEESKDEEKQVENIFNVHGRAVGVVTKDGKVANRYGRTLGSVDDTGTILNVSNIAIGTVDSEGKVINQSGTVLGSVNKDGEIFNVSERKVGFVKDVENINLIGGAARLLFLK